jgi:hypothetical protein
MPSRRSLSCATGELPFTKSPEAPWACIEPVSNTEHLLYWHKICAVLCKSAGNLAIISFMRGEWTVDDTEARIRQDIEQTRTAMTAKIGMIQDRMEETVEETGATVARVVNSVLEQVQRAQDIIGHLTSTADATVARVQATAQQATTGGTPAAELINDLYQRPWVMMGTAILLGYVLGSGGRSSAAPRSALIVSPSEAHQHGYTPDNPAGSPFISPASPLAGSASASSTTRIVDPSGNPIPRS